MFLGHCRTRGSTKQSSPFCSQSGSAKTITTLSLCTGFLQLYQIKIQGLFKTSSQIQELFNTVQTSNVFLGLVTRSRSKYWSQWMKCIKHILEQNWFINDKTCNYSKGLVSVKCQLQEIDHKHEKIHETDSWVQKKNSLLLKIRKISWQGLQRSWLHRPCHRVRHFSQFWCFLFANLANLAKGSFVLTQPPSCFGFPNSYFKARKNIPCWSHLGVLGLPQLNQHWICCHHLHWKRRKTINLSVQSLESLAQLI